MTVHADGIFAAEMAKKYREEAQKRLTSISTTRAASQTDERPRRRGRPPMNPARDLAIIAAVEDGKSCREAGAEHGISQPRAYQIVVRRAPHLRPLLAGRRGRGCAGVKRAPRKDVLALSLAAAKLYAEGKSFARVGIELGVSTARARSLALRGGATPRALNNGLARFCDLVRAVAHARPANHSEAAD